MNVRRVLGGYRDLSCDCIERHASVSQQRSSLQIPSRRDDDGHPELINTRFAYVSVSRAAQDARIYTNNAEALGQKLSHDASKTSALDFRDVQANPNTNAA